MNTIHGDLASGKWQAMPFSVQMGNIGSEINRVIHWHEKNDSLKKEQALWRALELLDMTIAVRKSNELLRLREIICDLFLGKNIYNVSQNYLKQYFLQFALYKSE